MKHYLLFTLLMICSLSYSQKKGYSKGYVVTIEKDTLYGYIKSKEKVGSSKSVNFINDNGDKTKYKPRELIMYSRANKIYRSFQLPENILGSYGFMQELCVGRVSLYSHYRHSNNMAMGPDGQMSNNVNNIIESLYLKRDNNSLLTRVRVLDFKKQISTYFIENKELSDQILNKEYRINDIKEIVEIYNEEVENK